MPPTNLFIRSTLNAIYQSVLRVPHNWLGFIWLLQILPFILCQSLPIHTQRLIHTILRAEPDKRAANIFINPRERNLAHLPAFLVRKLLYSVHDGGVCVVKDPASAAGSDGFAMFRCWAG